MAATVVIVPTDLGAEQQGSSESAAVLSGDILELIHSGTRERPASLSVLVPKRICSGAALQDRVWYLENNRQVVENVRLAVLDRLQLQDQVVLVGGDHSSSIGSIIAARDIVKSRGLRFGVLWIDSHPDLNTPSTSPSGRLHGMALATAMGFNDKIRPPTLSGYLLPEEAFLVGIESIDPGEADLISSQSISFVTRAQARTVEGLKRISEWTRCVDSIYVSIDLDVLSEGIAPGVNAPVPSGLTVDDVRRIVLAIASLEICMFDIVEYNMCFDVGSITRGTARTVASILQSRASIK